ncbi:MAG: hypothetical protein AUH42_01520 [Gemmatimonadetes bacterium 13_1_40CM_70_11]|nr:MAG: hypothetical protein AUH42_01520 [Gemmatimonadetes bacterium 13_1_40CM_70_11]
MNAELAGYLQQIEAAKREAATFLAGMTDAQFNWRPSPERWSIGQCFDHLNVSVRTTLPAFDRAIAAARVRGRLSPGPFRYGWFARWMVGSMEPPVKRRQGTFKILRPAVEVPLAPTLAEFRSMRDQLAERARSADGLDLRRVRVVSPVFRLLRLPLGAYFAFVLAHDRRHLWQARNVRAAPEFPGR